MPNEDEGCQTCGGTGLESSRGRETYCLDCEEGNHLRLEDERLERAAAQRRQDSDEQEFDDRDAFLDGHGEP